VRDSYQRRQDFIHFTTALVSKGFVNPVPTALQFLITVTLYNNLAEKSQENY
jgi:hypothetical protein